ncbi:MAG: hypothetical protein E6H57_18700 [Betaproteobacteria bacterium]|nr:MAG: hypothetical protein E6H57_18700 [Betaproteobacteria bacterium]
MSAPAKEGPPAGKPAAAAPAKDPYVELAEKIYINLSARVYGTLSGTEQKKPDPKALAAFCFKLADAFELASNETPRRLAEIEATNKASVKLADVDLSSVFQSTKKS